MTVESFFPSKFTSIRGLETCANARKWRECAKMREDARKGAKNALHKKVRLRGKFNFFWISLMRSRVRAMLDASSNHHFVPFLVLFYHFEQLCLRNFSSYFDKNVKFKVNLSLFH